MPRKTIVSKEVWAKIEEEYISTSISLRGLSKKYGIPFSQVRTRYDEDDWKEKRESVQTITTQKSIDLIATHKAEECTRAFRIANKVLDKLESIVDNIDVNGVDVEKRLKSITSSIKDLKEIGVFRSALDQAEQEARIKKLQKDAEEEQKDTNVTVTFAEVDYAD